MKTHRRFKTALLVFALLLVLAAGSVLDSRYHLQLTEYTLFFPKLPESFDGCKVVQLSDLHGMRFGAENRRLVELVRQQEPDIIVLTGDIAGKDGALDNVEPLLSGIEGLAPTYYVNGNHEWADGCVEEIEALMKSHGVTCLSNEIELLYRGEDSIAIVGAEDPNGRADMIKPWGLSLRLGELYSDHFSLWLAHRNDYIQMYSDIGTDLILCGHGHGGIVRLPFVGGLLNVNRSFGAEYESGVYSTPHFQMVVSRGLGNSISIPRLFNRPEVVTVTLHKEK